MTEFGIEWRHGDGRTHIGGEYTLEGARRMLAGAGDGKKWDPHAARVVVRDVSEWRDVESPATQGDSPSVAPAEKDQSCDNKRGGQRIASPASTPLRPGRSAL